MSFLTLAFILIAVALTIIRLVINAEIYRNEYDSETSMDDIAEDFSIEETRKRDEASVLFLLSLFTLFWLNYSKEENKNLVWKSNITALMFVTLTSIYFIFFF